MAKDDKKVPAQTSSDGDVAAFLTKVAATPAPARGDGPGRLIFAMDATASRQPTWDRATHIQAQMFQETAALGGLALQVAFYRGFGEFRVSSWQTDARRAGVERVYIEAEHVIPPDFAVAL